MTRGTDPIDLSGEPTGEPYLSAALGASYEWALGAVGDLDLSGRYAYRGKSRCNADSERQGTCQVSPNFKVGEADAAARRTTGLDQHGRQIRPRGLRDQRAGRPVRDGREQHHDRHVRHAFRVDLRPAHVGRGGDGRVLTDGATTRADPMDRIGATTNARPSAPAICGRAFVGIDVLPKSGGRRQESNLPGSV